MRELDAATHSFILRSLASDRTNSYWGVNRVRDYLRQLKQTHPESKVNISTPKETLAKVVTQWIEQYDPDLAFFRDYHSDFETSRAKSTAIYDMPSALMESLDALLASLPEKPYDIQEAITDEDTKPHLLSVSRDGQILNTLVGEIVPASKAYGFSGNEITELWPNALTCLEVRAGSTVQVEKCVFTVRQTARMVTRARLDLEQSTVELSTDTFYAFDSTGESLDKNVHERFRRSLSRLLQPLEDASSIAETVLRQEPKITKDLVDRFRNDQSDSFLIVPCSAGYDVESEFREEAKIDFPDQHRSVIEKKVKSYYQHQHTFRNFLRDHPEHDPDHHAEADRYFQQKPNATRQVFTCLVFFLRPRRLHERGDSKVTVSVDSVKVTFDAVHGILRGASKEDTAEQVNAVLNQVRRLLQVQS